MEIPNLPTDNLYKFMATSGVVIVIVGFLMNYYGTKDSISELNKIKTENCLLEFDIENLKKSDSLISIELDKLESDFKKYDLVNDSIHEKINIAEIKSFYKEQKNRDLFVFLNTYRGDIFPEIRKLEEIKLKRAKRDELEQSIKRNEILLNERYRIWESANSRMNILIWMWSIFNGIGALIASIGFILWYRRVQKYMDQELKNKNTKPKNL